MVASSETAKKGAPTGDCPKGCQLGGRYPLRWRVCDADKCTLLSRACHVHLPVARTALSRSLDSKGLAPAARHALSLAAVRRVGGGSRSPAPSLWCRWCEQQRAG